MKSVFIALILLVSYASLIGQDREFDNDQFKGYVIDKDNNRMEGVLELDNHAPWEKQRKVRFITQEKWDSGDKIKKKDKAKYTTKDISEYGFDGRVFMNINYKNTFGMTQAVSNKKVSRFNKISSGLKNMKSNYFAEVYQVGSMSMYKFYNSPPDVTISGTEETAELKKLAEDCRRDYDILVQKEGEGAKRFEEISLKKYFKDCKYVSKKFKDKEYTKQPVKGLKSMVKNSFLVGDSLAAAAKEMVDDYNEHCGEK